MNLPHTFLYYLTIVAFYKHECRELITYDYCNPSRLMDTAVKDHSCWDPPLYTTVLLHRNLLHWHFATEAVITQVAFSLSGCKGQIPASFWLMITGSISITVAILDGSIIVISISQQKVSLVPRPLPAFRCLHAKNAFCVQATKSWERPGDEASRKSRLIKCANLWCCGK